MRPVYKKIKVAVEHCPKCDEELQGLNNGYIPWTCQCGVWRPIFQQGSIQIEYEIIPKEEKGDE